jgi:hypothetical protein
MAERPPDYQAGHAHGFGEVAQPVTGSTVSIRRASGRTVRSGPGVLFSHIGERCQDVFIMALFPRM